MEPQQQWWVLQGSALVAALKRAAAGEDPDLVFVELYANSESADAMKNELDEWRDIDGGDQ